MFSENSRLKLPIALFSILIVMSVFHAPSIFKWWFEDDPFQFHYLSQIVNPLNMFANPEIMRGFSKALVPVQMLSYWVDVKLFGFSTSGAYLHSFAALFITGGLLFAVVKKWTKDNSTAFAALLIWLLMPSTLVVVQFLATRHYLEGLLFTLISTYFLLDLRREEKISSFKLLTIFISGAIAMLCKEIYAPLILALFVSFGVRFRKYSLLFISILCAIFYGIYRIWVLGTDVTYTMPFLGFTDYLKFLSALPYTFSANIIGYFIYFAIILATFFLIKQKRENAKEAFFFLMLLGAVLIALYPVAFAVLISYKTPGTWYRVPFIINTIVIVWGVYAASRVLDYKKFCLAVLFTTLLIIPGAWKTRKYWNERTARAEAEGKFYLKNPDKLLLSEEDAPWFIDGVHRMYNVGEIHYLNKQNLSGDPAKNAVSKYPAIWRYQNGSFVEDSKLYCDILKQNDLPQTTGGNCENK
jgi:Dolichyl-phosphate-mannose-protein mannosyltransferase